MRAAHSAGARSPDGALRIALRGAWLVVSFPAPVRACSSAIVRGGLTDAAHVAWRQVRDDELRPPLDPARWLDERLRARGLARAVGLLTSRDIGAFRDVAAAHGEARARCIATVGLGNALRAGDLPGVAGRIGTINLLVSVESPMTDAALIEASAVASEAKAAAMLESGVVSRRSGRPATGTGTDCTVITCPRAIGRARAVYSGKHTAIGAAVGEAAYEAVRAGAAAWLAERRT